MNTRSSISVIKRSGGFSLIELMLSITIGSFLILGASYAFQEAKRTYLVNDNVARLQEQAQFVLDVLEEDVRLSNYWGLHNRRNAVIKDTATISTGSVTNDCASDWALDLSLGINGTNNTDPTTATVNPWAASCVTSSEYQTGTDTLVIRHADSQEVATADLEAGGIYLSSSETPLAIMFIGAAEPAGSSAIGKNYAMRTHGYYVRNYTFSATDAIPMLRRMTLVDGGATPAVQDQELAIGVEDFQVEFGVDTDIDTSDERGSINLYIAPDNPLIDPADTTGAYDSNAQVISVRVWVLMRAQNQERNFTNNAKYSYGSVVDRTFNDGFRRLLVSRTFQVRNMER